MLFDSYIIKKWENTANHQYKYITQNMYFFSDDVIPQK